MRNFDKYVYPCNNIQKTEIISNTQKVLLCYFQAVSCCRINHALIFLTINEFLVLDFHINYKYNNIVHTSLGLQVLQSFCISINQPIRPTNIVYACLNEHNATLQREQEQTFCFCALNTATYLYYQKRNSQAFHYIKSRCFKGQRTYMILAQIVGSRWTACVLVPLLVGNSSYFFPCLFSRL